MISIRVFDRNTAADMHSAEYLAAYRMWHDVWRETYDQLGLGSVLHSDNFTRQEQVLGLFIEGKCAGLSCYRSVDLSSEPGRNDSWLADWPADLMDELCAKDPLQLVGSAFAVAKEFRRQDYLGLSLKDLLAAANVRYFDQHTGHYGMLGSMRNSRGTNTAVYKYGVTKLRTVEINHEPTDLVIFLRDQLKPLPSEIDFLFRRAWIPGIKAQPLRRTA